MDPEVPQHYKAVPERVKGILALVLLWKTLCLEPRTELASRQTGSTATRACPTRVCTW